jgi:xylulokinase
MTTEVNILTHDIGTTGNKSCLYRFGERIELLDSALVEYSLYTLPNGGVEQKADEWWAAVCQATQMVVERSGIAPSDIKGMAFCAQMQGFVAVDADGEVLRNPMSYMDNRGTAQIEKGLYHGFPRISGWNAYKTLRSLIVTGGLSASVKDPVWKYLWMRDNEPELFSRLHRWLDVKDYLVLRCTGEFSMARRDLPPVRCGHGPPATGRELDRRGRSPDGAGCE